MNVTPAHNHFTGRPGQGPASKPAECTTIHTRILRCMLAAEDCHAYWRHADTSVPATRRARLAFEHRWFGTKSEARVRTLMTDMVERFDAYPEALALLHQLGRIPAGLRSLLCHLHTQLADPIYRRFSGSLLAERRDERRLTIDRAAVARWVDSLEPGRWSPVTCLKFASNMLATAFDVGLVRGRRDPRQLPPLVIPGAAIGYALYWRALRRLAHREHISSLARRHIGHASYRRASHSRRSHRRTRRDCGSDVPRAEPHGVGPSPSL